MKLTIWQSWLCSQTLMYIMCIAVHLFRMWCNLWLWKCGTWNIQPQNNGKKHTYGCQPKNRGGPHKSSILIGFSIIFTIHFGGKHPYFWKHPYVRILKKVQVPVPVVVWLVWSPIWFTKVLFGFFEGNLFEVKGRQTLREGHATS